MKFIAVVFVYVHIVSIVMISLANMFCPQNVYLRTEFDFWKVHGIMNTSGLWKS